MNKILLAVLFIYGIASSAVLITLSAKQPSVVNQPRVITSSTSTPEVSPTAKIPELATMSTILGRLAPPPTVYPPKQADQGAQVYYQHCMTCHGDQGQGLTDEFRQVIGPPDSNCWASHCHTNNHVEGSFVFPHVVPAVVGSAVPEQFKTAANLHAFIQTKMPYQAPGSLTEAEYWQLTAYLLRANGIKLNSPLLDDQTAQKISLVNTATLPTPKTISPQVAIFILFGTLALILVFILLVYRRKKQI